MYTKINNDKDLQKFLNKVGYFHDGVIHSISYISGSYGDVKGIFPNDIRREIILRIQGCQCGDITLKFCDITKCVILPSAENTTSEIYQSNIQIIDNKFVYVQDVEDVKDKIKITKQSKTNIISNKLFYEITSY